MKQWDLVSCSEDDNWTWERIPRPGDIIKISEDPAVGNLHVYIATCIDFKEPQNATSSAGRFLFLNGSQILQRWFYPYEVFIRVLRETCDE